MLCCYGCEHFDIKYKISSHTINFNFNFQILYIFAQFFKYFPFFLENRMHTHFLEQALNIQTDFEKNMFYGEKKSCITIKQNFVQTPTVINQVFVAITFPLISRQFASFYCWWFQIVVVSYVIHHLYSYFRNLITIVEVDHW